jgi:plastocyanin
MPPRRSLWLVTALALVLVPVLLVQASAGSPKASKKTSIIVRCKDELKPNRWFKEGCRFGEDSYKVKSGATITINNKSEEPHTFSLVKKSEVPRTLAKAGKCFEGGACARLSQAHGFPEGEGPPANPLVNVGAAGFDAPGDSVFFDPKSKTPEQITAKKGQTLYFICIIHPQMQSRIKVR